MTKCECPLAGICERHNVDKNEHWHKLCQTRENYFNAWEEGRGPGQAQKRPVKTEPSHRQMTVEKDAQGRAAWIALHSYSQDGEWSPSKASEFYNNEWLATIPKESGCPCRNNWKKIEKEFPPVFTTEREFIQWGFDAHNKVNAKLGKNIYRTQQAWEDRKMRIGQ